MFGKVIDYFRGTTRLSLFGFFVSGHLLTWFGKLTPTYIVFMTAFLAGAVGHSIKEDYFQTKGDTTSTTVATPDAVANQTIVKQSKDPGDSKG